MSVTWAEKSPAAGRRECRIGTALCRRGTELGVAVKQIHLKRVRIGTTFAGSISSEVPDVDSETFCDLVLKLTGTVLKNVTDRDRDFLSRCLADDDRPLDCAQFNELLLVVNKDRVEEPFFERFFGSPCKVRSLGAGVARFQTIAMLAYGNFIFAYRQLSRAKTLDELDRLMGKLCIDGDPTGKQLATRPGKMLDVEKIEREDTPLIGYLSATIVAEAERARLLLAAADSVSPQATWDDLTEIVKTASKPDEWGAMLGIVSRFKQRGSKLVPADFRAFLKRQVPRLKSRNADLSRVQSIGISNQDVYMTWDEMDVYFATSMRKAWEYEDLYDFITTLMASPEVSDLDVRFFDPTQSYTPNRIDKGLVESLMLKRAKCTVYSVQDTDTLGKDSELAATLAQGKPVIAYIPRIKESDRAKTLAQEDPITILERLRFVLYADEKFTASVTPEDFQFINEFLRSLTDFSSSAPFISVPETEAIQEFRSKFGQELERICKIIADSEKRVYDKRADTLKVFHPLAIRVNLDTGVGNGLLISRAIDECAELLRRVLTRTMEFRIEETKDMWYLRESLTGSIFRVVTKNTKISNCFWNFYLRT